MHCVLVVSVSSSVYSAGQLLHPPTLTFPGCPQGDRDEAIQL